MSALSYSVPFSSAPATLCNHKANKAGKVSERDKEEEQKPENSGELTLVSVLVFDDCCDKRWFFASPNNSARRSYRDDASLP